MTDSVTAPTRKVPQVLKVGATHGVIETETGHRECEDDGDVRASLDRASRTLTLDLRTIDPATGWFPEDPLLGLLYPEDGTCRGVGSVSYDVKPRTACGRSAKVNAAVPMSGPVRTPLRRVRAINYSGRRGCLFVGTSIPAGPESLRRRVYADGELDLRPAHAGLSNRLVTEIANLRCTNPTPGKLGAPQPST